MLNKSIIFSVNTSFWIVLVFAVIMLPVQWVLGWLFAVSIHELGHAIGIMIFRIPIFSVSIKCSGVYIQTGQMLPMQEIIVAALGPLAGLIPVTLSRFVPYAAVCALIHFAFNMLPIICFDGGRVLYRVLQMFLPSTSSLYCMKLFQIVVSLIAIFYLVYFNWNTFIVAAAVVVLLRTVFATFPCKPKKQIVQWSK